MKIINKGNLQVISADIEKVLEAVGKKHGISITRGKGRYSNGPTGTVTLELSALADDGTVMTRERREYIDWGRQYDLKPEWLDQEFESRGEKYTIVGLDSGKRKFPVVCQRVRDNATYNFPLQTIMLLKGAKVQDVHQERA